MAMQTYTCDQNYTFTDSAAAATITITLPAPGSNAAWIIDTIWMYALGILTVFDLEVLKNDGTTKIARAGGQLGTPSIHTTLRGPIATKANDRAKIVLTATGASAVQLTVNARLSKAS